MKTTFKKLISLLSAAVIVVSSLILSASAASPDSSCSLAQTLKSSGSNYRRCNGWSYTGGCAESDWENEDFSYCADRLILIYVKTAEIDSFFGTNIMSLVTAANPDGLFLHGVEYDINSVLIEAKETGKLQEFFGPIMGGINDEFDSIYPNLIGRMSLFRINNQIVLYLHTNQEFFDALFERTDYSRQDIHDAVLAIEDAFKMAGHSARESISYGANTPEPEGYEMGDVTCDGRINICDIANAAAVIAGKSTFLNYASTRADINGDGKFTVLDLILIKELAVG